MELCTEWKPLDSNDQNQVADQRFSLKQWFAGGAHSHGLRKPGCGHCYLRFFARGTSQLNDAIFRLKENSRREIK